MVCYKVSIVGHTTIHILRHKEDKNINCAGFLSIHNFDSDLPMVIQRSRVIECF